jgi:hypothetical protein
VMIDGLSRARFASISLSEEFQFSAARRDSRSYSRRARAARLLCLCNPILHAACPRSAVANNRAVHTARYVTVLLMPPVCVHVYARASTHPAKLAGSVQLVSRGRLVESTSGKL